MKLHRPALMGIVNITPDSFSDGGRFGAEAFAHAAQLVRDGADILDLGAESTRPGAQAIGAEEEWARLEPVLMQVMDAPWRWDIRVSVDTRHYQTAERALALGVDIINDQGGLGDSTMRALLSEHACDVVVMHALSLPANPKVTWPVDADVIGLLLDWKKEVLERAAQVALAPERMIFDAGIGFGKTAIHSVDIILRANRLIENGGRWLFGQSRKSFLTLLSDVPPVDRDPLTQAFSVQLAMQDVPYLRVHDVAGHRALFDRLCT